MQLLSNPCFPFHVLSKVKTIPVRTHGGQCVATASLVRTPVPLPFDCCPSLHHQLSTRASVTGHLEGRPRQFSFSGTSGCVQCKSSTQSPCKIFVCLYDDISAWCRQACTLSKHCEGAIYTIEMQHAMGFRIADHIESQVGVSADGVHL